MMGESKKFDQSSTVTLKRFEIGCKLVLITDRKSHTGFRLVPKSVTLNDLERYNDCQPAVSLQ